MLAISLNRSDPCDDRNPVKEKLNERKRNRFSESDAGASSGKQKRKAGKNAKPTKKAGRAKKPASKPKADRTNKKADVIAMMKRAKGATLPEIIKATGWQPHTVRGFVSILGSKGGEKIESFKNAAGERTYKIGK